MTGARPSARVAVVVLNYNGLEDTLLCLESLAAVRYPSLSVILVDNASAIDPTLIVRRRFPDVNCVRTRENLGYAGGNNRGIEFALESGAEYVLILNNDTTVDPAIVDRLLEAFDADAELGIVGPVINFMLEPDRVMTDGVVFNPGPGTAFFHRLEVPLTRRAGESVPVDIVNGCCMMIRADVLRQVGAFDERLFIVHEESDLCLRAAQAGFTCAVIPFTLVLHKGSSSFDRTGRRIQRYFDTRNLWMLLRRHSGRTRTSRSTLPSLWHCIAYAYYRHEIEVEGGKAEAARAVVDGLWDAWMGRTGPYAAGPRHGAVLVSLLFGAARWATRMRNRIVPSMDATA